MRCGSFAIVHCSARRRQPSIWISVAIRSRPLLSSASSATRLRPRVTASTIASLSSSRKASGSSNATDTANASRSLAESVGGIDDPFTVDAAERRQRDVEAEQRSTDVPRNPGHDLRLGHRPRQAHPKAPLHGTEAEIVAVGDVARQQHGTRRVGNRDGVRPRHQRIGEHVVDDAGERGAGPGGFRAVGRHGDPGEILDRAIDDVARRAGAGVRRAIGAVAARPECRGKLFQRGDGGGHITRRDRGGRQLPRDGLKIQRLIQ